MTCLFTKGNWERTIWCCKILWFDKNATTTSNNAYQAQQTALNLATIKVASDSMTEAAAEIHQASNDRNSFETGVSADGTWQKHGYRHSMVLALSYQWIEAKFWMPKYLHSFVKHVPCMRKIRGGPRQKIEGC